LTPIDNPLGIQLDVKGMKNLRESFRDYVKVDTLEGDNKYSTESFGPQDAKKGVIFQSFPPVLNLHLKRFEYDVQRGAMIKVRLELHRQCIA
jgi:ubiquitin carboxyl-terminal hydrolase 7